MPEAVIVAAARSPIGRAFKGSLTSIRPDDLTAQWSAPRWTRCRSSTRPTSTTSSWAAACPAASRASTWPGWSRSCSGTTTCPAPRSPGTARRRCRPPGWRCTRSGPARATCSSPPAWRRCPGSRRATPTRCPDTRNPLFAEAGARTAAVAEAGADRGPTRARTASCPTSTSRWARPPRTSRRLKGVSREDMDRVRRPLAEPRREGDRERLLGPRDHAGHPARRHGRVDRRRPPRRASPTRRWRSSSRSSAPTAGSPPATAARSTTAPPRWSIM